MDHTTLAPQEAVEKAAAALEANHFSARIVDTKEQALEIIKAQVPEGASVMNGTSTTLQQIGYIDYLKEGAHGWNNLHGAILAESDPAKQALLRRQSVVSDYYLGSVHALTQKGEMVIASNTGSQLPHLTYTSPNLILVVGANKIVPALPDALARLEEVVVPLENERAIQAYGSGTLHAKTLILHKENPKSERAVLVILVNEPLGF